MATKRKSPTEIGETRISTIGFGIFSDAEKLRLSVCEVKNNRLYEKGKPKSHSLYDLRMGTTHSRYLCQTCAGNIKDCPGHYGHVKLKYYCFNVEFLSQLFRVLSCVCCHCSNILLDSKSNKYNEIRAITNPRKRLSALVVACSKKNTCFSELFENGVSIGICNGKQPQWIRKDVYLTYTKREEKDLDPEITMRKLMMILRYISDDDIRFLGMHPSMSHPLGMVMKILLVPPPNTRPSKTHGRRSAYSEDDLTCALQNIVKLNENIRDSSSANIHLANVNSPTFQQEFLPLQRSIANYQFNRNKTNPNPWGQDRGSLRSRLSSTSGKNGRMRRDIAAKRQNHSARTVVTGSTDIDVDEVGVPILICMRLAYKERVNSLNLERMKELVQNGPHRYPGANYVIQKGNTYNLRYATKISIRPGDIVGRHLRKGDYVLFNRQPSLHRNSLMAHRVYPTEGKNFTINVGVTPAYNADFDGDEMNMQLILGEETRAECSEIMSVNKNLIKDGKPIVQLLQHAALSCFLLTQKQVLLNYRQVSDLFFHYHNRSELPPPTLLVRKKPYWTGIDILSSVLPSELYLQYKSLKIVRGTVVSSSPINKEILNKGIVFTIWKDLGWRVAVDFINGFQKMLMAFLDVQGTTIHIDDCRMIKTPQHLEIIQNTVRYGNEQGAISNNEYNIMLAFDTLRDFIGDEVYRRNSDRSRNGLYNIIESQAKGNLTNAVQIAGMLGQQIDHKCGRVAIPTSHFRGSKEFSYAHGLVTSSFTSGLNMNEFFHHMQGGREGLVDTAVKTGQTGYIQRKLAKMMEDLHVYPDSTVRQANGDIVEFAYGGDGMCGNKLESLSIASAELLPLQILDRFFYVPPLDYYRHDPIVHQRWQTQYLEYSERIVYEDIRTVLLARHYVLSSYHHPNTDVAVQKIPILCPIDFRRLLSRAAGTHDSPEDHQVTPFDLSEVTRRFWKYITSKFTPLRNHSFELLFLETMSAANVCGVYALKGEALRWMIDQIEETLEKGQAEYYDAVGIVAAQNCTEPMTQMTLSRFHKSGQESNLEKSVERLQTILNCTHKPEKSTMMIPLKPEIDPLTFGNGIICIRLSEIMVRWARGVIDPERNRSFLNSWCEPALPDDAPAHTFSVILNKEICKKMRISPRICHRLLAEHKWSALASSISHSTLGDEIWWLTFNVNKESETWASFIAAIDSLTASEDFITQHIVEKYLKPTILRGIPDIDDFFIAGDRSVVTKGSRLMTVLVDPNVLPHKVTTSNINEIFDVLGIDAACLAIQLEWRGIMKANQTCVDDRHISLIADKMCYSGKVVPMTYSGLLHDKASVIKQATFEKPFDSLLNGAIRGELDDHLCAMSAVCFNTKTVGGTGSVHLYQDEYGVPLTLRPKPILPDKRTRRKVEKLVLKSKSQKFFIPWSSNISHPS